MSRLSEAIKDLHETPGTQYKGCAITRGFEEFPEDKDDLIGLMKNHRYSSVAVARVLTSAGIKISDAGVRRHRNDQCDACKSAGVTYR